MKLHLGVKSDPIENRYTFEWLFDLIRGLGLHHLQMGSSFATFHADDGYFVRLRAEAEKRDVRISSVFTSHRELGGFASGDPLLEKVARRGWERMIHVASLVGAGSAGSNVCIVMRDQPHLRERGILLFAEQVKDLLRIARRAGLSALTIEPMSSLFEYPSTPDEVEAVVTEIAPFHAANPDTTVPLLLCADISHGVADAERRVVHDNWTLFEREIPWMREFHFKNTDAIFDSTFGFDAAERERGIVDLRRLKALIASHAHRFPAADVIGYLEIGGPKLGREYADRHLERMLVDSIQALKAVFSNGEEMRP